MYSHIRRILRNRTRIFFSLVIVAAFFGFGKTIGSTGIIFRPPIE
jgi:hypothetical protein